MNKIFSLSTIALCAILASCGGGGSGESGKATRTTVVIGDSITLPTGLCDSSTPPDVCSKVGFKIEDLAYGTYLPNVLFNAGIGGDTCIGVKGRIDKAIQYRPAQISLLVGINDIRAGRQVSEIVPCIEDIWVIIRNAGIEPIAVTYALMPGLDGEELLNAKIRISASKLGVTLVDFEPLGSLDTVDTAHPTAESAKKMAQKWLSDLL